MIPKASALKLITIYLYICELHDSHLKHLCQRYSNNDQPKFSDQEIITVYLYVMQHEQRCRLSQIYQYANDHLRSWFPNLPSYSAFNYRINRLGEALKALSEIMLVQLKPDDCRSDVSLLDSMPIITCSGKRTGKVAREITDKGYCGTKSLYYYGLKIHLLGFSRPGRMPHPEQIIITEASESDLNVYKQYWSNIENRKFFGDKIYHNIDYFENLYNENKSIMLTPVKGVKNEDPSNKQRDKAANDLFNKAVSRIRQPIESLFNWLIEKTDFQRASKVRATKGLIVHVFGKLAAAYIYMILNP